MPGLPKLYFNSVDVRDVAKAHVLAMENPKTDGERIILIYDQGDWAADFSGYLAKEFGPQGYRIPTCNLPYLMVWLGSFFDETAKDALGLIGVEQKLSNNKFMHPCVVVFHGKILEIFPPKYDHAGMPMKTKG